VQADDLGERFQRPAHAVVVGACRVEYVDRTIVAQVNLGASFHGSTAAMVNA
jgi:hypothetical protein